MILSDRDIREAIESSRIKIDSPDEKYLENIGPSSLDLRCGSHFKLYEHTKFSLLDPADPATFENCSRMIELKDPNIPFIVQPNDFILGVTLESVTLSADLVARVVLASVVSESSSTRLPVSSTLDFQGRLLWKLRILTECQLRFIQGCGFASWLSRL
jgi:deoxycytidine triphosphate deaminase